MRWQGRLARLGELPTFPLGHWSRTLWKKHERMLAHPAASVSTSAGVVTWMQDPVDFRGLPAIGRGVQRAIRGTRPGDNLR